MTLTEFGTYIKDRRLKLGYSLRRFCIEKDYDPVVQSSLERGLLKIDTHFKLEKLTTDLETTSDQIEKDFYLTDLAAFLVKLDVEPLSESEILGRLPAFLCGRKDIPPEELDKFT
jgi:transcriptional regulator with XRE-family HTH domain